MKYQTEYQRNYQKRTPKKHDDLTAEERKLNEVPLRHASSSPSRRRRRRSLPSSPTGGINRNNNNFAVIGPNEKFSQSHLYRMKQPVKDHPRVAKSQEYALLGPNDKFQDNVVYPLRKPVVDDSPKVIVRRRKSENHSCGIQTEFKKAPNVSFDPRVGRETAPIRRRPGPQSEYQEKFHWKQSLGDAVSDQMLVEDSKVRDRRSDPVMPSSVIDPSEKLLGEKSSVAVNTPARVEIDVDKNRQRNRVFGGPTSPIRSKKDQTSEYQARYKPIPDEKRPRTRKAFEAEQAEERKRKQILLAERAHTDDEGPGGNANDFGIEFRQKHPHGKLRRWKSEYQTTFKPFWRFDYKNGRWYKDAAAEESGFNPNLFWYKELVSTRKRAEEFRANAQADHFNRDHTLQLQTGYGNQTNYRAWDANDEDDADSVISIDRDLERERLEGQRRREIDARRQEDERIQSRIHYEKQARDEERKQPQPQPKTDQTTQSDHQVNRVIYIDEPPPQRPSAATKAFVRNLGSSSVQQHMLWDSESLYSARTNSDVDFKSNTARDLHRKHYTNGDTSSDSNVIRQPTSGQQESRGTGTHSPPPPQRTTNGQASPPPPPPPPPPANGRASQYNGTNAVTRPATSFQDTRGAAGRSSYDTHTFDKRPHSRPHSSAHDHRSQHTRSHQDGRFKDEVTEYYYRNDDNKQQQYTPAARPSFQNHLNKLDERFGPAHNKDDDVLSVNSARSLSSSCSLASQTHERAQQNLQKYWGNQSATPTSSPKKTYSAKH